MIESRILLESEGKRGENVHVKTYIGIGEEVSYNMIQEAWSLQSNLYWQGFPCHKVGCIAEVEGHLAFEEFVKKRARPAEPNVGIPLKEITRLAAACWWLPVEEGKHIDCAEALLYKPYAFIDCICTCKNNARKKDYRFIDLAHLDHLTGEEWFSKMKYYWPIGDKPTFFKMWADIQKDWGKKWKSLFRAESVKRKLAAQFQKVGF